MVALHSCWRSLVPRLWKRSDWRRTSGPSADFPPLRSALPPHAARLQDAACTQQLKVSRQLWRVRRCMVRASQGRMRRVQGGQRWHRRATGPSTAASLRWSGLGRSLRRSCCRACLCPSVLTLLALCVSAVRRTGMSWRRPVCSLGQSKALRPRLPLRRRLHLWLAPHHLRARQHCPRTHLRRCLCAHPLRLLLVHLHHRQSRSVWVC